MLWKRIAILTAAGAALGVAAPAFADPPYWAPAQGNRYQHHAPRAIAVHPRPVVFVRPAPVALYRAPVYYGPAPMPAYRVHGNYAAGGALAGAVAGALIGGSVGYGDQRVAAIAIGSLVGAVIGHELAGGH